MISRIFPNKIKNLHITSVSGQCMHFLFKICQTVRSISFLAGFCYFAQLCKAQCTLVYFGKILVRNNSVWPQYVSKLKRNVLQGCDFFLSKKPLTKDTLNGKLIFKFSKLCQGIYYHEHWAWYSVCQKLIRIQRIL